MDLVYRDKTSKPPTITIDSIIGGENIKLLIMFVLPHRFVTGTVGHTHLGTHLGTHTTAF